MFHVPELSRVRDHPYLSSSVIDGNNGAFILFSPEPGARLMLICSDGRDPDVPQADGWEHVSVHAEQGKKNRTPTWKEMVYVKELCWDAEDVVIQYHPRRSEYVNCHPHTLHLWRTTTQIVPIPPSILVGPLP